MRGVLVEGREQRESVAVAPDEYLGTSGVIRSEATDPTVLEERIAAIQTAQCLRVKPTFLAGVSCDIGWEAFLESLRAP